MNMTLQHHGHCTESTQSTTEGGVLTTILVGLIGSEVWCSAMTKLLTVILKF